MFQQHVQFLGNRLGGTTVQHAVVNLFTLTTYIELHLILKWVTRDLNLLIKCYSIGAVSVVIVCD